VNLHLRDFLPNADFALISNFPQILILIFAEVLGLYGYVQLTS